MGYNLEIIVDTKDNIQKLIESDNFSKTRNDLDYFHKYKDMPFCLPNYSFDYGDKAWHPMLLLIHLIFNTSTTTYIIEEKNWKSIQDKILYLSNEMINDLWSSLRAISISALEKEAVWYSEEIKEYNGIYNAWNIDHFELIEREYMDLYNACYRAKYKGQEMLLGVV